MLAAALVALLSSACLESRAQSRPEVDSRLAKELIVKHRCGTCHVLKGHGFDFKGRVGPDLSWQSRRGRSAEWLRRQLLDPTSIPDEEVAAGFEGKQKLMPKFNRLTRRELDTLVEFLQTLGSESELAETF